ncbi:hypothetical protein BGZ72_009561 [Mortierella alpina]|nr:hypothetical protein BGZ72_009561 [Mortierella alpina]
MHSPPPVAEVENLDQYLLQEGETEDEYKRIFDLRYSIVLVPFASEADREKAKQEKEIRASRRSQSRSVEPEESRPTSNSRTGHRQFPTPTSMPREKPAGRWSARQMTLTGGPSSRTPTPLEKSSRHDSAVSSLDDSAVTDHDDEDDYNDASNTQLMPSDPLSSYLHKAQAKIEAEKVSVRRRSDASTELDDWESFHDALDHPEDNTHQCKTVESTPLINGLQDPSSSSSSSGSSGTKRHHWELSPSNRLMQPREPSTPSKRFALGSSVATAPRSIVTAGLMKPRSFTPRLSFPGLPANPFTLQRRSSILSEASVTSTCSSSSALWSKSNWKDLEVLYTQMNGNSMDEAGLVDIATRFLDEHESRTGERPSWTSTAQSQAWSKPIKLSDAS